MKLVAALANRKKLSASSKTRSLLGVSRRDLVTVVGKASNVRMAVFRVPLAVASLESLTKTRAIFMPKRVMDELGVIPGDVVEVSREAVVNRLPPAPSSNPRGGIVNRVLAFLTGGKRMNVNQLAESTGLEKEQVRNAITNLRKTNRVTAIDSDGPMKLYTAAS